MNGDISRGCLRCGKLNYKPAGVVDSGPPIYGYCVNCVLVCIQCKTARQLTYFWPNKNSAGWIAWRATSKTNIDPSLNEMGNELGPARTQLFACDFLPECKICMPFAPKMEPKAQLDPVAEIVLKSSLSADDMWEQYQRLIRR